ncbi:ribose/xylose/arabinose/galactoside ABC-type transport system permease subunit [Bradyrhizobium sp. LM3.4]
MQLVLEKRAERSNTIALISPLIAIGLTIVTMVILFAILGKNPLLALHAYFIAPLTDSYSLQEIAVKATPLVMIAIGLSLCYLANAWNIGAEGQFLIGAVAGSWIAVKTQGTDAGVWVLPVMLVLAAAAGALYALIPAICKVKFGASEILTSLMLVYVADLFLDYLVRGPWRDPHGFNFPTTAEFDPVATVPLLIEGGRLHLGSIVALLVVAAVAILLGRTIKGFEIRVVGAAPRAARFGGFNSNQLGHPDLRGHRRARGPRRYHRGRRTGRASPARHLAGLRFYRDHRCLPRPIEPAWNINCRPFSRVDLYRRRAGADHNEGSVGRHQGFSGHPAVLRARLRFPHSLPLQAGFPEPTGGSWNWLKPSSSRCSPPRRRF